MRKQALDHFNAEGSEVLEKKHKLFALLYSMYKCSVFKLYMNICVGFFSFSLGLLFPVVHTSRWPGH